MSGGYFSWFPSGFARFFLGHRRTCDIFGDQASKVSGLITAGWHGWHWWHWLSERQTPLHSQDGPSRAEPVCSCSTSSTSSRGLPCILSYQPRLGTFLRCFMPQVDFPSDTGLGKLLGLRPEIKKIAQHQTRVCGSLIRCPSATLQ